MALHEQTFNQIFGETLRSRFHTWKEGNVVRIETSGQLRGNKGRRPDVVVVPPGGFSVVFESAYADTADVDKDARCRTGKWLDKPRQEVMTGFVIVIPPSWREYNDIAARAAIEESQAGIRVRHLYQGSKARSRSGFRRAATREERCPSWRIWRRFVRCRAT